MRRAHHSRVVANWRKNNGKSGDIDLHNSPVRRIYPRRQNAGHKPASEKVSFAPTLLGLLYKTGESHEEASEKRSCVPEA